MADEEQARPHMSKGELLTFKKQRQAGTITVFHCGLCEQCKQMVPKQYRFCSQACFEKWDAIHNPKPEPELDEDHSWPWIPKEES